jgi:hypothetical protein
MVKEGTRDERRKHVAMGLAVGVGILVGALAGPGLGWAQMPAPSSGAPGASMTVQPRSVVPNQGYRGSAATPDPRHQIFDRDGDGRPDNDRDWREWDRRRPSWGYGYHGPYYYPRYGYYDPGPYGTYPGRWVWDGWNWIFVPIY